MEIAVPALMWLNWCIRDDVSSPGYQIDTGPSLGGVEFGLRSQNSGDQGHPHEIGQARGLHLGHQVGAVDLDRARADSEVECDLFVGKTGYESFENVTLAI